MFQFYVKTFVLPNKYPCFSNTIWNKKENTFINLACSIREFDSERVSLKLKELHRFLAERNIKLVVFIVPDREFVPSEYFLTQTATENNISYLLTAILDNKDGRLLGGMSGTLAVSYAADGEKNHLTLPQKVVCHDPEHGAFVWCVDGQSRVKRVAVTLGKLKKEDRVEILSGVSPADRVITTRLPFLSEQEQVTIEE